MRKWSNKIEISPRNGYFLTKNWEEHMFIRKYKFILLSGFVTLLVFSSLGFGSSVAQFIDTDPLVQFEENGGGAQRIIALVFPESP